MNNELQTRRRPWRLAAVLVGVVTAITLVVGALWALSLKLVFEPTSDALFQADVGSQLLPVIGLAGLILVIGVIFSRPSLLGPNAHALAVGAAVIALSLSVGAQVRAYRRLHPSLAAEQTAVAQFAAPPGAVLQYTTAEVTATPNIQRDWTVPGPAAPVCAEAQASLTSLADPGTVRPVAQRVGCRFEARRGGDQLVVDSLAFVGAPGSSLTLIVTRQPPQGS